MFTRRWGWFNALALATFAALVVGAVWLALNFQNTTQARDARSERETHSLRVIVATQKLLATYQDAETGQRGFQLTNDPAYLAPYRSARERAAPQFDTLRRLTADNALQRAQLVRVSRLSERLLGDLAKANALVSAGDRVSAQTWLREGAGKATMDAMRVVIEKIQTEEARLLNLRRSDLAVASASLKRLADIAKIAGAVLIAILGIALVQLVRSGRREAEARIAAAASERVLESRNLMQSIMDNSGDPIYVKDREGRFVFLNQRAARLLTGSDPDVAKIIGKADRDFLGSDIAAPLEQVDRQIMMSGISQTLDERVPEGGVMRVFLSEKVPWRRGTEIIGLIGISRDITERVSAEAELKTLTAELDARVAARTLELSEALSRLKNETDQRAEAEDQMRQMQKLESIGQLSGGIAHDFNNMLSIIMGSLEMAKRRMTGSEHPRVAQGIDAAFEGATRAASLTARLLAFSRQQPLAPTGIDANKLVGNTSELLQRTLGDDIRLETVLAGGLWPVFADMSQLENAMVNLAVNARDAMPDGGRLTIETANTHLDDAYAAGHVDVDAGQYVAICVSDTGTGMSPETVERVFDPFFTTKDVGKGTGLGLSQVFGFIKQSGGHIKIYSEVGQGTTVKLYLPRHFGAAVAAPKPVPTDVPRGNPTETILVVEDEDKVREIATDALRELGYRVIHTGVPATALEMIEARDDITLLFTDIMMADMTGRELADRAVSVRPDLRILYTTGYTRNAVVHNGIVDLGVAFLAKPYTTADLARKIRAVLDGAGVNRR